MAGQITELRDRGVVAVGGADAEKFLGDLITSDIARARADGAVYGGLLAPQGKILFDFIVHSDGERFLFDLPRALVADFLKRLGFYRLRAKVEIADLTNDRSVVAAWGHGRPVLDGTVAADPRLATLGWRAIVPQGAAMALDHTPASEADYHAHRVALGVPEGGIDFAFGDAFPHDADMDQLGGVDFRKGCYIGQEVVSRMEHRGTARRRFVHAEGTALPASGTPITAGDRPVGTLASTAGEHGLALVRLDRAREAMDANVPLRAGDATVTLKLPAWARFTWPEATGIGDA